MPARFIIPAILQVAVPLAMLGWQAWGRNTTFIAWSLKQTAVWSYIYTTSVAGLWLAAPWYVPHALMLISISLAARSLPDALRLWRPPARRCQWMMLTARASTSRHVRRGSGLCPGGAHTASRNSRRSRSSPFDRGTITSRTAAARSWSTHTCAC